MLNDDFADRTLPPTERHRRESRSRGEVARSTELTSAVILLSVSCLFWFLSPTSATGLVGLMRNALTAPPMTSLSIDVAAEMAQSAARLAATVVWPILLVLVLSGLAGNLTQTGWLWTPAKISPRFRFGGMVSWDLTAKGTGTMLRLCVVVGVTMRFLMIHDWQLRSIGTGEPVSMLVQLARMLGELSIQLSLSLVLLALIDYGYQFWRHEQRLKMTVEERRREQQDEAIDPRIRQRRTVANRRPAPTLLSGIGQVDRATH